MRVLVTGAGGQLGRALFASRPEAWQTVFLGRRDWDLAQPGLAGGLLARHRPEVVVNAAAYTKVDEAERERELAHRVNCLAVAELAEACARDGVRLIHISTDFVFDGLASSPYKVDAALGPLNVYGAAKLAGEQAVRASGASGCVVRTAWVYQAGGRNFVLRMLELMRAGREVSVVADQTGTPTWAATLAETVWALCGAARLPELLHWTDAGVASWYDLAVAVQELALELELLERETPVRPVASEQYPTLARRPAYSVLDKSLTYEILGLPAVHWRRRLREMLQELADGREAGEPAGSG